MQTPADFALNSPDAEVRVVFLKATLASCLAG